MKDFKELLRLLKLLDKEKFAIIFLISLAVVLFDQLVKLLITINLSLNQKMPVIQNFLSITFLQNTGAAFGILKDTTQLLIWIGIFVMIAIIYFYKDIPKQTYVQIFIALLAGGTLSNLIDRISFGSVVDFISFSFWPAFNIADAAITVGGLGLIYYLIKRDHNPIKKDNQKNNYQKEKIMLRNK